MREHGWRPVVAPELEFFLTKINEDPDYPLEPPIGRSRRPRPPARATASTPSTSSTRSSRTSTTGARPQEIDIDTLTHEGGAAQMEINFNHGDPLELADQAFLFKRTLRQAALKHGIYATFMAKPMEHEPGSAMHVHQSVFDRDSGAQPVRRRRRREHRAVPAAHRRAAALPAGGDAAAGAQRQLLPPPAAPLGRPDQPALGLGEPHGRPARAGLPGAARRVENRVAGADANPYLAIAASLACGLLGMLDELEPTKPIEGSAYRLAQTLPRHLSEALELLRAPPLRELLGDDFVEALIMVKEIEHEAYQRVISSWEREHLLLNV